MAYKTFKVKDDKGSTSLGIGTTIKTFFISLFSVIYNYIYTFCFKLGNRTLFIFSHSAFFVKKGVTTAYSTSKRFLTKRFKIFYKKVSQNSKDFFEPVIRSYTQIRRIYATIRRKGKVGFFLYFKFAIFAIISSVTGFVKMLFRLSGILVPILAVVLFLVTVNYFNNLQYVVLVEDNGERIGYIANENTYELAEKMMRERLVLADDDSEVFTPTPTFKLVFGTDDNLDDEYALCDKIIKNSGSSITEADGLYVDGKFYGATEDGQTLQRALDNILAENSSGKENERVSFVQEVEIKQGLYPVKSVSSISEMTELLHSEVEGEKLYTVQRGDTPYAIASMNGIKLAELTALNPGITKSLLPGQQVLVSQAVPFLSTKTIVTETYEEKISYKSTQIEDSTKYRGVASVVQYGKNGKQKVTADVTYIDGVEVERNILSTEVLVEPVNQITKVGTKLPVSLGKNQSVSSTYGTGKFMWPAAGGYVSCGFYGYRGHTGMDIAVPTGTPIYASDTGVVVVARNSYYGYGRYIKIDHGSNVQTLYAHNYKLLVKVGDVVKKGDLIAYSGSTGNSSGPHLHFEVIINGSYKNPANYVSRY